MICGSIRDMPVVQARWLLASLDAVGSRVLLLLTFFSTYRFTLTIQSANIMAIFWKLSRFRKIHLPQVAEEIEYVLATPHLIC